MVPVWPEATKFFIGQVIDDHGSHTTVKFIGRKDIDSNIFKWPDTDDIDVVSRESVLMNLSEPQTDHRGLLTFSAEMLSCYNIE